MSTTHAHPYTTLQAERAYNHGLRHFAVCEYNILYYPASEAYPGISQDILANIVETPATEFRPYGDVPEYIHVGSLGSLRGDNTVGNYNGGWRDLIEELKAELVSDYFHAIINHPTRRQNWDFDPDNPIAPPDADLNDIIPFMIDFYDYDPVHTRGIEIYNNSSDQPNRTGHWSVELWDELLKTGRHFYCHTNPDHVIRQTDKWRGYNYVLLPDNAAQEETLKAYQNGNFYSTLLDTGLKFTKIEEENGLVSVELNDTAEIKFITENGVEKTVTGTAASFQENDNTFVRIEVEKEIEDRDDYMGNYNEKLFS